MQQFEYLSLAVTVSFQWKHAFQLSKIQFRNSVTDEQAEKAYTDPVG